MFSSQLIFKETLFYSISKAIPGLIGLVSIVFFMRFFGAKEYGAFSLMLSQCNLIAALGFGWINQALLRYHSTDFNQNNYKKSQLMGLLYSVLFCLFILPIFYYNKLFSFQTLLLLTLTIISIGSFNYIKTFYQVKLLPRRIIILTGSQSFLALLFPMVLLFIANNSKILLLGVSFSFILVSLFCLRFLYDNLSNKSNKQKTGKAANVILRKWVKYGSPLSIWFAAGLALPFLDRFFINQYLSGEELGLYASIQELLVRSFSLTLFPFTLALHPRIMNFWNDEKPKKAIKLIYQGLGIILVLGIIIISFFWVFNDFVFWVLQIFIPQFDNNYKILIMPLLSAGFLWQLSLLTHKMLELKEQTFLMVFAIMPSLIINLVGNIYFLPIFGILTTAYTAFFSALIYCVITMIYSIYSIRQKTFYS
tara:strand:+ start:2289 stop:3554 length:1266 start_codon:yes stop_codon:yes gene_type:complete